MHPRFAFVIFAGAGLLACGPSTTAPETRAPGPDVSAAPTPTPGPTPTPAPTPTGPARTPTATEDDPPPPPRPPKGIVDEGSIDFLMDAGWLGDPSDGPPDAPPALADLARCEADPTPAYCRVPEGLVAVKGDAVAVRAPADNGGCGDFDASVGWTASAKSTKPREKVSLAVGSMGDSEHTVDATWRWMGKLAARGFVAARPLIAAQTEDQLGIRGFMPLALLREPLAGWFLDARERDAKGTTTLALVSPDNQTRHVLGALPAVKNRNCDAEGRKEETCGDHVATSVLDVALSQDGKSIFVFGTQMDGSHCGPAPTFFKAYPLPAAAR